MSGHTVVVIQGSLALESCEQFSELLRLPVSAYYHKEAPDSGEGYSGVEPAEAEGISDTLYDLSELVAMANGPDVANFKELQAWAKRELKEIAKLLQKAEAAIGDETEIIDAAESLRVAAYLYSTGLRAYDAEQV